MEFMEEESRPRFLFQSRPSSSTSSPQRTPAQKPSALRVLSCFSLSLLLLFILFISSSLQSSQTLTFLLLWISLSLLVAPFAPSSVTGGDAQSAAGTPLHPPPPTQTDGRAPAPSRRSRSRRPYSSNPNPNPNPLPKPEDPTSNVTRSGKVEAFEEEEEEEEEELEWTDEDLQILKKQILKHPVGEPRRWEKISEAFGRRHGLESVIKMGKSMAERKPEEKDSFAKFLKQRKPLDKRVEGVDAEVKEGGKWSSGEDIALLNALKAFPKEVAMRWEKVAAAVPGRSKAECVKRVAELKKDFRSSKAA
ncbi:uncharacterized protein A4U43_C10F3760 [Asparagus officinalis]|uniref:Myb-like domain-containing protein n=1 Tax=Asparagus officinalis TaxID=4686 RepID=A0A5P1E275_ASPOF|nr:uncharacterized protein F54F2.9 [Asparagus officinalis]ONK56063.1 uncharacterized protein A4U43_C10F3760 [Asparagus officinalis]